MKKLQNDFTTPEQSKRLLVELGVPADSANYCYECSLIGGEKYYARELLDDTTFSKYKRAYDSPCVDIIPCWSVGRLAEIYNIISMDYVIEELILNWSPIEYSYIEYIIDKLRENIDHGLVDFSKLED